jgi:DNA-binding CsgD family transcriptional regulator
MLSQHRVNFQILGFIYPFPSRYWKLFPHRVHNGVYQPGGVSMDRGKDGGQSPLEPQITAREGQVLQWIAIGKSDWEIGKILNISAKTVNYHVEKAKRRFGVATRIQAVMVALKLRGPSQ